MHMRQNQDHNVPNLYYLQSGLHCYSKALDGIFRYYLYAFKFQDRDIIRLIV